MGSDKAWFRKKLAEKRQNQATIAAHLEIDQSAVSRIISGDRKITEKECRELSNLLEVSMEETYSRIGGSPARHDDKIYSEFVYKHITEMAEKDGQYAIAFAILELSKSNEKLRSELCFGNSATDRPGVIEQMAMEIRTLSDALKSR